MKTVQLRKLDLSRSNNLIIHLEHISNDGKKLILAEKTHYNRTFKYSEDYEERFFILFGYEVTPIKEMGISAFYKFYTTDNRLKSRRYNKAEAVAAFMKYCREDLHKVNFKIEENV